MRAAVVLTSSHVNKTLVLRIYLLSLPRKSEKSVKIGNGKPYREPLIWGGPSWEGLYVGNRLGGDTLPPHMRAFSRVYFPPQQGAMGPWAFMETARFHDWVAYKASGP